ncbi:MAG: 5-amino-6-(D-ribitylamino)uracil--L-tyrosine 4-hydroxyphenyl transferase CofH, partial [Acidobacteria bacterium]|nr:5-amino-6-(D-ribitylamino)uracil--L-tyrosine 4-hydroxyphenyl transferase CofH [Acidobacteriota bacterium]
MTTVTFLRLRPAEHPSEKWAAARHREGSTTVEVDDLTDADRSSVLAGGLLPVTAGTGGSTPVGYVAEPADAMELLSEGVPGWRITVAATDDREATLDALARTEAAYLRVGRSRVAWGVELAILPGIDTSVSVFVDTVEDAVVAAEAGATDLLLRAWDTESLAELRDALFGYSFVERTALPPGVPIDEARERLDRDLFKAWLDQIDGAGTARPRTEWAPGKDLPSPHPPARFSNQWPDAGWLNATSQGIEGASQEVRLILERSLDGARPTRDELERLFLTRGAEVDAIASVADTLRQRTNGDTVTYVVNRNINYTNQCYFKCGFCAFSKGPRSLNLREDPYLLTIPQVVERSVEAWGRGATEVCLQGGIHPEFTGEFYVTVVEAIKAALPDMHIHGFTPLEVWQGADTLGMPVRDFLIMLRDAGLGTLPGTAAEILDDRVRAHLCPDKIRTSEWAEVMLTAHELGLRSTSTIMFGHIDDAASWANHLEVLRTIQERTGGFTEIVPLPFVHMGAPIYLRGRSRPGPTWDEIVLIHAVSRIAVDGLIENIQGSWVKLGLDGGAKLLDAGCNDLGGTLMGELISAAAGASHGTETAPEDFEAAIRSVGRVPQQRSTLYAPVEA